MPLLMIHRFRPLNDTEERTGSKVIVKFPSGSDDQCVSISGKVYMFDKVCIMQEQWRRRKYESNIFLLRS